jgi:6-pyruvoyltetrahydropterin/6-carboxytetrahydropterin synthase
MNGVQYIERDVEFDIGHRLVGHESKCARLHGHRYRFVLRMGFASGGKLDAVGRVLDFSVCKQLLNDVVEPWDHRMVLSDQDALVFSEGTAQVRDDEIVVVPFNPTAENMAAHIAKAIAARCRSCFTVQVEVYETPNCRATSEWFIGELPAVLPG